MNIEPKAIAGDIPVYCSHDEIVDIMKVIPNPKNPNTHGERQIEILSQVIKAQGWRKPITVSKRSGFVVAGHGRLQAALKLQTDKVPVDYQDYATEAEEYADLVADNRIAELSEIDHEMLNSILEDIKSYDDFDFELTGYTDCELDSILGDMDGLDFGEDTEAVEDDYEVELPAEPKAKPGEIYQLGSHRLMCGDSTKIEDVEKLMDGVKADMVFTDPPYNVAFNGRSGEFDVIKNDNLPENEFNEFIHDVTNIIKTINPPIYYIWCNWKFYGVLQEKMNYKSCIVWAKNVFGMGKGYRHQHEFCLFNGSIDEGINNETDLWEVKKDHNYVHPTQKPIELSFRALNNHKNAMNILDLFGGSGSTLIGCEQQKRNCFVMEIDPHYIDVIIDRWEKFTGEKAVLLNAA